MKDLISVIVPVYNVEKYLDKCIKSIVEQTYKNLEIFLVDDGSNDNCPIICDNWGNFDNRIIVLHKKNGGQGSARNVALDKAKGNYICFVDSDDCIKKDCIEFLYKQLQDNNLDISACNIDLYDENNRFLKKRCNGIGYIELNNIEAINSMWSQGPINVGPWAKLYKKILWKNIRFKECFGEDLATMHFVFEKADKIGYSYESKLNYLVRNNSAIRSFQNKKFDLIEIAKNNIAFCEKYPELLQSSKLKAVSIYFHLLFQVPNEKQYIDMKNQLKKDIKLLRRDVLKYKNCTKKIKYAIILSYFGFGFTKIIFKIIKKKKIEF